MSEQATQPVASREHAIDVLVDLLQEANRRDIAALERQGWPGIPGVPDYDMRVHCGHLVDALLAAGVFREPPTRAQIAEEIAVALDAEGEGDKCSRFKGYTHADGCGGGGLECAAIIIRDRWAHP